MDPVAHTHPIVVAGMHRSGTSLAAGILSAHGVLMGQATLPADRHNEGGYYEDLEFLELQARMLWEATPDADGGHRDWGWTESEQLDRSAFDRHAGSAVALVERRRGQAGASAWGWKNPRTTLQLDFWDRLLDHPRYLLLYRYPWEVADSMQRLGADVFLRHPDYSYRIWEYYNRQLLAFKARVGERAVVVGAGAILASPARFDELVRQRLLGKASFAAVQEPRTELFHTGPVPTSLIEILEAVRPSCLELLRELERIADLPCGLPPAPTPRTRSRPVQAQLSVIIPCFNHGEFLIDAVASAEAATATQETEILIANDGSTEPWTLTVLKCLAALGFTVLDLPHRGLAATRNFAAATARGHYLLPLDADNRIRPEFVGAAVATLANRPEVGVVFSDRFEFGLRRGEVHVPELHLPSLLLGNYIDACAVIRREAWEQSHGWDAEMPTSGWEDWDLWITLAGQGWHFARWPGIGFDYRVRPDSLVTQCASAETGRALQEFIVRKHEQTYIRVLPELIEAAQEQVRKREQTAAENVDLRIQSEAWRAQHNELSVRATSLETAIATLESSLGSLRAERESWQAERQILASELQESTRQLEEARSAQARLSAAAVNASEERGRLVAKGAVLVEERDRLSKERDRLYSELEAWRRRVAAMEQTTAWKVRTRFLRWRGLGKDNE